MYTRPPPITPGPDGIDPCDARCPAVALVYVEKDGASLALCGHCFDTRMFDLFANGWAVRYDFRPQVRKQETDRRR